MNHVTIDSPQPYLVVESPYELPQWRPLVNWVLYIPHAVILYGLRILSNVVFFVYWLMLIFTGTLHPGMFGVMAMYQRYNARASGFLLGYSETYPPFDFAATTADNNAYPPVRLTLPAVPESVARSAALNVFKAIPHYFVLMFFFIGAAAVAIAAWFAVLFTGVWPAGMRAFLVRVSNYYYRVWTYVTMVDDTYPGFGLPSA
jgi:Domain of unknown function (DUF4389)